MKKTVSTVILVVMALSLVVGLVACSPSEITITFDTNAGYNIDTLTFEKGVVPDLSNMIPSKDGYKFVGWFLDKELQKPYDTNNIPKESFTLYAKYERLGSYTITFESNGGSLIKKKRYTENNIANVDNYIPRKQDSQFLGWYEDIELTIPYQQRAVNKDITLYAKYGKSEHIYLRFETYGGDTINSIMIKRGEQSPDISNIKANNYSYKFEGWYFDEEFTIPYDNTIIKDNSFVVYAKYSYIKQRADFIESLKQTLALYDLDHGFNIKLNSDIMFDFAETSKDQYNWKYGLIIEGNMLNDSQLGNNDLTFKIVDRLDNNKVVLGITNIGEDIFIEVGTDRYKLTGFNFSQIFMQGLSMELLPEGTNLGNIQFNEKVSMDSAINMLDLVLSLASKEVKLRWENNIYTYTMNVGPTVTVLKNIISGFVQLPQQILDVLDYLGSLDIAIEAVVTENEEAIFTDLALNVIMNNEGATSNGTFDSDSSILVGKVNEDLIIEAPLNPIDINLLKHSMTTSFDLKDINKNNIGHYDLVMRIEFGHETMQEAVITAMQTKSIFPIVNSIFTQKDGRIYIDLTHKCDATCKLDHLGNNKSKGNNGSVLTIAFDPSETGFNNERLYVAADLRMLATNELFNMLDQFIPASLIGPVKGILAPKNMGYLAISIDMANLEIYDSLGAKLPPIEQKEPVPQEPVAPTANIKETISKVITLINTISNSITTTPENWDVDFTSIWNAIEPIIPQDSVAIVKQVVNSLLLNVDSIVGTTIDYANDARFPVDFNVKDAFLMKNETTAKKFSVGGLFSKEAFQITGKPELELDEKGRVNIISPVNLYDNDGNITLTVDELYKFANSNPTVNVKYLGTNGKQINSKMTVYEIRGVDLTKFDTPQKVTLVLGKGVGDILWDWLNSIGNIVKLVMPEAAFLANIALPNAFVTLDITLVKSFSGGFIQTGIADPDLVFNPNKEYTAQDLFNTQMIYLQTYTNGSVKETIVNSDAVNELTDVTKPNNSMIKYYDDFEMNYVYLDHTYTVTVKVKDYIKNVTYEGLVNEEIIIDNEFVVEGIDEKIIIDKNNQEVNKAFDNLATEKQGIVTFIKASGETVNHKLTFAEAGTYTLSVKVKGITFNFTFNITDMV